MSELWEIDFNEPGPSERLENRSSDDGEIDAENPEPQSDDRDNGDWLNEQVQKLAEEVKRSDREMQNNLRMHGELINHLKNSVSLMQRKLDLLKIKVQRS
ncbi:hypothetical protein TKK_0006775 [Trichogramma kaykai]